MGAGNRAKFQSCCRPVPRLTMSLDDHSPGCEGKNELHNQKKDLMKERKLLIAAGLLLAALAPWPACAGANTWNNNTGNFVWGTTNANWTSPTTWTEGDDAIFGATGVGNIILGDFITVSNMIFNVNGYDIVGAGFLLTNYVITADGTNTIAASLAGPQGLVLEGTNTTMLVGDSAYGIANQYTGGTYIHGGTLILEAPGAGSSSSSMYAVDSIEALDTNATLVIPGIWNGTKYASDRDQIAVDGQLAPNISHLHMTGGTLDLWNDPKGQHIPVPDGYGTILNSGSWSQAGLQINSDGLDHSFYGVISDGNNGVLNGDNTANTSDGQGPGYQIGIVQVAGGVGPASGPYQYWYWYGSNTYSGSTRLENGVYIKLMGQGTIGFPSTNGQTGPMRLYSNSAIDLNGHNQTISLMTAGDATGTILNSGTGTVSTLTIGYGNEQVFTRSCSYTFEDNAGGGGILALRKVISAPFAYPPSLPTTMATNSYQTLGGVCTYSGDTTVEGGSLTLAAATAVSPNSAYRLSTNNYALLTLSYAGTANVRQLWINGAQQPNGVYGAGTPGIDPASTGTITVTGYAPVTLGFTQSANTLTLAWQGVYKLQVNTNDLTGAWYDYPGGAVPPVQVPTGPATGSAFYRLTTLP